MLANFYWIRCDIDLSGRGHLKADNEKTGNSQATQDWLAETGVNKATRAARLSRGQLSFISAALLMCPSPRAPRRRSLTGRSHGTIVGPTGRSDPGYVRLSVRPVGQTVGQNVAEPPTSVNQINVAC